MLTALLALTGGLTACLAAPPLVGLCGQSYRAFYAAPLEMIGAQGQLVSGEELRDPAVLQRYQALIFVTNADPSQEDAALPAEVERNLAAYVEAGGASFVSPGQGSGWLE